MGSVDLHPNHKFYIKRLIWTREGGKCFYCHTELKFKSATIDHIIPKSMNGPLTVDNTVCACKQCNNKRGHGSARQFLKKTKKQREGR